MWCVLIPGACSSDDYPYTTADYFAGCIMWMLITIAAALAAIVLTQVGHATWVSQSRNVNFAIGFTLFSSVMSFWTVMTFMAPRPMPTIE